MFHLLWFISVFVCEGVPVCVFMSIGFIPEINLCYANYQYYEGRSIKLQNGAIPLILKI